MDFENELNKYSKQGNFNYKNGEDFSSKCNAPNDCAGIYLIYKKRQNSKKLIYIGSSGQRDKEGKLKVRQGGLFDRLTNGYHPNRFGQEKRIKRKKAFPLHMSISDISEIEIFWYVTYDKEHSDFPTDVENKLTDRYKRNFDKLPEWHKQ